LAANGIKSALGGDGHELIELSVRAGFRDGSPDEADLAE
jgi:hypothetical protein